MKLTALVSSWSKINPVAKVHGQRLVGATVASVYAGPGQDVELILAGVRRLGWDALPDDPAGERSALQDDRVVSTEWR
jgi:hypothetical protein